VNHTEREILSDGEIIDEISVLSNNSGSHDVEFARRIEQAILNNFVRIVRIAGVAGRMPGTDGFTMAVFNAEDVPLGTMIFRMKD
jgi:hypothetical protein